MTVAVLRPLVESRDLATDEDWWRVRDLLVRSHAAIAVDWNWEIRRWDGARYHHAELQDAPLVARGIRVWESGGHVVAAAHSEDAGEAFFELDPDYRDLEPEMLDWSEEHLAEPNRQGGRRLRVYIQDYDMARRALLAGRGYLEQESGGWVRIVRLGRTEIAREQTPAGYEVRITNPCQIEAEARRMGELINAAFGRSGEYARSYLNFVRASPSFSHSLNLVAVAPDGAFASHVGATYDHVNRFGILEPVCTHPDHRRLGLARALVHEAVRRLRERGATSACVGTGDKEPANALYRSCGFHEEYRGHWWQKDL